MPRLLLTLVALFGLSIPVAAQTDSTAAPTRVLTHTFTTPSSEFVRVRLESGQRYRARVNHARARLEARPVSPGVQPPRVRTDGRSAGYRAFVIEPQVTAEYEIRVLGLQEGAVVLLIDRTPPRAPRDSS